ncbi:YrzE family protein [Mammaliicoccus sciuri]|uniref:YrzE family protein n=2 Tax=Mammaliicoccus sciuri TaxID=1296 RepID=UPI0015FDE833|nr:YrzE family protein [Mammaliicoccus sciuri]
MINIKKGEGMKDKFNLVLLAILGIFAFILFFGFVLSNIDPDNKLEAYTIAISFIGIFATFGGAYLGAKISGENASKLAKKESMINDLNRTMKSNNKVLEDFKNKGLKQKLDFYSNKNDLKNTFDVNNFIINFFEFKEDYRHFRMNDTFESTFPLLSYDFKELEKRIEHLSKELCKYNEEIHSHLYNLIKEHGYNNHTIYGLGSGIALYINDDENAILETMHMGKIICISLKNSEINKAINNSKLMNINDEINNFKKYWTGFKFKTKDDIRDFIAKYYGDYH